MQFQAKTKQQIDDEKLLPKGDYDFEIEDAEEHTSKAGNSTIKLTVRVIANGHSRKLTDYILPLRPEKLRNCCAACGPETLAKYNSGAVNDNDFPGKHGRLTLVVEKKKGYAPRNVIADYLTDDVAE